MRYLALCLALLLAALPARAQETSPPALLLADSVLVTNDGRLIAEGNVEALHDGNRLTARRIVYNRDTDSLSVEGPLRLTDTAGNVLVSDGAELDAGFRNGLLRGARMVLDEQLQLAAVEARRVDGRYTQLSRVAVTSCQVCGADDVPLWQIRAARVIHDQDARQIYFDQAQLRVLDVPVFYLPRLRLPDPTLKRARGFLIPTLKSTTLLGFGIKVPYFIPLGDHADLTLTPYVSPVTRTLEYRIRRAFRHGEVEVNGAFSTDTLQRDEVRGYLFADGRFDVARGYTLSFDIETVSDASYLSDYDYADKDRLDSALQVERVTRDRYTHAGLYHFESLRATEDNATQPTIVGDLSHERRVALRDGGELRFAAELHGHYRYSDRDTDGPDDDTIVDGRDVLRLSAQAGYVNRWTLPGGLRAGVEAMLWADAQQTRQDSTYTENVTRLTPAARAELRWPLAKTAPDGARILLEPIAQIGWIGGDRRHIANDESTRVEFDEGNLLALSRFPAADRRERGTLGVLGLRWLREDPRGWSAGLTLGRVWKDSADPDLSQSSGLSRDASDWLIAGQLRLPNGLALTARGLLDDDLDFSKAEARASLSRGRLDLDATYVLLIQDPDEDRDSALSEWNFSGAYQLRRNWTASTSWRYDLAADQFARAGLGLDYRNECVEVGFSVSRRFASSTNVEPSTNFGLTVALKGFSTGGSAREYRRSCS